MNQYGQWLACADGIAHYELDGWRLCDATAAPTGREVFREPGAGRGRKTLVPVCPKCRAANVNRWACVKAA